MSRRGAAQLGFQPEAEGQGVAGDGARLAAPGWR